MVQDFMVCARRGGVTHTAPPPFYLTFTQHRQLENIKAMIHTLRALAPTGIGIGIHRREMHDRVRLLQRRLQRPLIIDTIQF